MHDATFGSPVIGRDIANWYACHTRSRAEKRVARSLLEKTVEAYLPTLKRRTVWADRTKLVTFPLFPGYVFVRFALRDFHCILSIPGVATVVRLAGRPAPISNAEIENIRRFEAGLAGVEEPPEAQPFLDGHRVRVTGGPLEGVEGVVMRRRGRTTLHVGLRTIGQGIAVQIDSRLLEEIG